MNKHIVLIGLKSAGKTTVGKLLATHLGRKFIDTDTVIEALYKETHRQTLTFSQIYKKLGYTGFHDLEQQAISHIVATTTPLIIATGGSSLLFDENVSALSSRGFIVYLQASYAELLVRWQNNPPSFIDPVHLAEQLTIYYAQRAERYHSLAQAVVTVDAKNPADIADEISKLVKEAQHD